MPQLSLPQTTQSNASHVLLRNVPTSISGKFACEVSADAPTFDTSIVAADMEVVGKCDGLTNHFKIIDLRHSPHVQSYPPSGPL